MLPCVCIVSLNLQNTYRSPNHFDPERRVAPIRGYGCDGGCGCAKFSSLGMESNIPSGREEETACGVVCGSHKNATNNKMSEDRDIFFKKGDTLIVLVNLVFFVWLARTNFFVF